MTEFIPWEKSALNPDNWTQEMRDDYIMLKYADSIWAALLAVNSPDFPFRDGESVEAMGL